MMFTELLQAEVWRKKLENAGYKVIAEAWAPTLGAEAMPPQHETTGERPERMSAPAAPPFLPPP